MTDLLTAAQMRAIEQAAIDAGEVTGLELMERAGQGVVDTIMDWRPDLQEGAHTALVLCGPGNNGGDGFVIARLLKEKGWAVSVFLFGDLAKLPPDARAMASRWHDVGGSVETWDDERLEDRLDDGADELVVDALFGTGLTRPMPYAMTRVWHGFMPAVHTNTPPRFVAVDLPSGICSDSGANLEGALPANLTVTFHRRKLGHVLSGSRTLSGGPLWCGTVRVVDIGLSTRAHTEGLRATSPSARLAKAGPKTLKQSGHKYDHGHALVLSGGVGRGGAARLTARGALRVGAGLVTVGCPPAA
ncbi:MAG: NAD(P)H-hydrate epimerase, partial [Pseudomonadota bacterium]